ncbi:dyskeratosis congenita 1 dyskerin [Striga asiatica]|uniref:Dyskeratosis congenita 1 dyskerin n=1 Tax=Striga asiatica TaxID=4170 RepID=A0A5A7Q4J0_STRAF|nr:dyskeratosis congenita 1 dyskerin [Striga asiatica]
MNILLKRIKHPVRSFFVSTPVYAARRRGKVLDVSALTLPQPPPGPRLSPPPHPFIFNAEVIQSKSPSQSISRNLWLRKVFRSWLLDFLKSHTEGIILEDAHNMKFIQNIDLNVDIKLLCMPIHAIYDELRAGMHFSIENSHLERRKIAIEIFYHEANEAKEEILRKIAQSSEDVILVSNVLGFNTEITTRPPFLFKTHATKTN